MRTQLFVMLFTLFSTTSPVTAEEPFTAEKPVTAGEWTRFRGPNGSGISSEADLPVEWSESENIHWRAPLPGPGSSSPIVVGDNIFVTCYSGYGIDQDEPGEMSQLRRHLVCIELATGKIAWDRTVEATLPELPYGGMIAEHGYASNTPVSDGEHIFVFFSKSGVLCYDLEGNQKWQTSVGTDSGSRHWGSGASPILFEDLVIVNASDESESLVALRKDDGKEQWRVEAAGMAYVWSTPVLHKSSRGPELVLAVAGELWGMNPRTGKLRWYAETYDSTNMCASVVAADDIVYVVGGRQGGAAAVRSGGKGDVTDSHTVWNLLGASGRITCPILHDGHLYWFGRSIANCVRAADGEEVYQERLSATGGGRRGRGQDYASPVLADDKFYITTRTGTIHVVAAGPNFELLASNRFESDGTDFSATPAVVGNTLLIRSNRFLYSIGKD